MALPSVDCVMVVPPGMEGRVRDAADDFVDQTYASRRLLIVAPEGMALPVLRSTPDAPIEVVRVLEVPFHEGTIAAMVPGGRARGDVVCPWDVRCRHHPRRLDLQVLPLTDRGVVASCLPTLGLFDDQIRHAYAADASLGKFSGTQGLHPETVCFEAGSGPAPGLYPLSALYAAVTARCKGNAVHRAMSLGERSCPLVRLRVPLEYARNDREFTRMAIEQAAEGRSAEVLWDGLHLGLRRLGLVPPPAKLVGRSGRVVRELA